MVNILIPSRNDDLLDRLFMSMERSQQGYVRDNIIVGDNGLSPEFRQRWSKPKYVTLPEPFTTPSAYNTMARNARFPYLLCLSDDTEIVTSGWHMTLLRDILCAWPGDYGLLNLVETTAPRPLLPGEVVESPSTLAFVATLIPRAVWDKQRGLDERYTGYGMDDTDFELRLLHSGLRIGTVGGVVIRHEGTVAYRRAVGGWEGVRELTDTSYDAFYAKWRLPMPENREMKFMATAEHFKRKSCKCARGV